MPAALCAVCFGCHVAARRKAPSTCAPSMCEELKPTTPPACNSNGPRMSHESGAGVVGKCTCPHRLVTPDISFSGKIKATRMCAWLEFRAPSSHHKAESRTRPAPGPAMSDTMDRPAVPTRGCDKPSLVHSHICTKTGAWALAACMCGLCREAYRRMLLCSATAGKVSEKRAAGEWGDRHCHGEPHAMMTNALAAGCIIHPGKARTPCARTEGDRRQGLALRARRSACHAMKYRDDYKCKARPVPCGLLRRHSALPEIHTDMSIHPMGCKSTSSRRAEVAVEQRALMDVLRRRGFRRPNRRARPRAILLSFGRHVRCGRRRRHAACRLSIDR